MKCYNDFCLYNRDHMCIIEEEYLELDIQGKCTSCTYVEIDSDDLDKLKNEQMIRL